MTDYVQVRNPRSGRWVKIDRDRGVIVSYKRSKGPYKGIPQHGPDDVIATLKHEGRNHWWESLA